MAETDDNCLAGAQRLREKATNGKPRGRIIRGATCCKLLLICFYKMELLMRVAWEVNISTNKEIGDGVRC